MTSMRQSVVVVILRKKKERKICTAFKLNSGKSQSLFKPCQQCCSMDGNVGLSCQTSRLKQAIYSIGLVAKFVECCFSLFIFDSGDSQQTCLRQPERSEGFITEQQIRNVFWPYSIHCFKQQYFKINYFTHRRPMQRSENWSDSLSWSQ